MNWDTLYSEKRTGTETITADARSEYQRDFDRLIFSAGFRRLQNKTQIFPLPGVTFVHNRLTHSLEVASVGRSLGKIIGTWLTQFVKLEESKYFYQNELQNVIAAACLAHDIGNPPFGHSGEKAISKYFKENETLLLLVENNSTRPLRNFFNEKQWSDLIHFEGNANGFRFITHNFIGKAPGGLKLTYTTLAATIKYPCESKGITKSYKHLSKYNIFQSEISTFLEICKTLEMDEESKDPIKYKRHPFVYLTEAADDICYNIVDVEDAVRLGIVSVEKAVEKFLALIVCVNLHASTQYGTEKVSGKKRVFTDAFGNEKKQLYDIDRVRNTLNDIQDGNDKVAYLRAKCINALTMLCAFNFEDHTTEISEGIFNDTLAGYFMSHCQEMKDIIDLSQSQIYNHDTVVKVELTGYKVLYELLSYFIPAILKKEIDSRDAKILSLLPRQFYDHNFKGENMKEDEFHFIKVLGVIDFISGMTDTYAIQLYRDLSGIDIVRHS